MPTARFQSGNEPRTRPTLQVHKSGSGTTGVYIASENGQAVVIKFLTADDALSAAVADKFMALGTGLVTPESRIIGAGQPGNAAIKRDIAAHAALAPPVVNPRLVADAANDTRDPQHAVLVMTPVAQVSLRELAQGRSPAHGRTATQQKDEDHGRLAHLLRSAQIARDFARILVSDALLGNSDRFIKDALPAARVVDNPANISNIFVSPDLSRGVALDNSVERASEDQGPSGPTAADMMMNESRTYLIRYVATPGMAAQVAQAVVKACLVDAGELTPAAYPGTAYLGLTTSLATVFRMLNVEGILATNLAAAVPEEMTNVTSALRRAKNQLRAGYDAAAAGSGLATPNRVVNYNALRARAKFLKARRAGKSEAQAQSAAAKHLTHKRRKDNR